MPSARLGIDKYKCLRHLFHSTWFESVGSNPPISPNQSHYPDIEPTSPFPILVMPYSIAVWYWTECEFVCVCKVVLHTWILINYLLCTNHGKYITEYRIHWSQLVRHITDVTKRAGRIGNNAGWLLRWKVGGSSLDRVLSNLYLFQIYTNLLSLCHDLSGHRTRVLPLSYPKRCLTALDSYLNMNMFTNMEQWKENCQLVTLIFPSPIMNILSQPYKIEYKMKFN